MSRPLTANERIRLFSGSALRLQGTIEMLAAILPSIGLTLEVDSQPLNSDIVLFAANRPATHTRVTARRGIAK